MRLLYPVRLAVRAADAAQALRILDAPFEGSDDGPGDLRYDAPPER
jgi:hypothetical protein